jgi:hypothetical protein
MKNIIKWALPLLLVGIIAACSFFKTNEKEVSTNSIPGDTVTKVIETDTLPEAEQDSVAQK